MNQIEMPELKTELKATRSLTQSEMTHYREDGYVIVHGLFDRDEMMQVQSVCQEDPNLTKSLRTIIDHQGKTWHASLWNGLNDSLVSIVTRTARMVEAAEEIAGEECYHLHSKIVQKPPHDQSCVDWHQGFYSWYNEGFFFADPIVTCTIAITENTKDNGCLQVIKKSHFLGRINHVDVGNSHMCDPHRMDKILERLELINCEMAPGDAIFFHANTIHGSQQNKTDDTRILMHCHYNAISNQPFPEYQEFHPYFPLEKLPDSAIKNKLYVSGFEADIKDWNWYSRDPNQ
ncbi:MAG: phytanoyl-CoA dioxygenase family protein [Symploca sp. SIO2C1]|nr:phytanoyl-CoA dioxygenase family protein [Symploca sp. SIO2C1]